MIYRNAVKYIHSSPDASLIKPSADRMRLLCKYLDNPQRNLKYIRLAGSNAKTVCSRLMLSVLKEANVSSGCLNMPVKKEIKDNIIINGAPISMEECADLATRVSAAVQQINSDLCGKDEEKKDFTPFVPTASEIIIAMALLAFKDNKCALCLIESDNSLPDPSKFLPPPFSAVICGTIPSNSKKEISKIRSYICHGIQEIVSAPQNNEAYHVISDTCFSIGCRLTIPSKSEAIVKKLSFYGTEFSYKTEDYSLRLCGRFEVNNALVALETFEMLSRRGYSITHEQVKKGLAKVSIPAKFELLSSTPFIIADSTHNPIAIETVCESMTDFMELTGNKVRLCLPEGEIIENYVNALTSRGYVIERIITLSPDGIPRKEQYGEITKTSMKSAKAIAKEVLTDLDKNTLLLISGRFSFTSEVRYEVLANMNF